MIRHLGSSLTDVTYVFDEPTIGLHPHDIERMNKLLLQLRDKGNTVLVVEHKPETIAIGDHVIDLGPGAGTDGGTVCFVGDVEELRESDTITGHHLDDRARLKDEVRTSSGALEVRGASTNNLEDVDVDIPLGMLCVLTGVAGSGKSSLIQGSIAGDRALDQRALAGARDPGQDAQHPDGDVDVHVLEVLIDAPGRRPHLVLEPCPSIEVAPGDGVTLPQLLHVADDDGAAVGTGTRPEVDDVVADRDGLGLVLTSGARCALVPQLQQQLVHPLDVVGVHQSWARRTVGDIRQRGPEVADHLGALLPRTTCRPAGQGRGSPARSP